MKKNMEIPLLLERIYDMSGGFSTSMWMNLEAIRSALQLAESMRGIPGVEMTPVECHDFVVYGPDDPTGSYQTAGWDIRYEEYRLVFVFQWDTLTGRGVRCGCEYTGPTVRSAWERIEADIDSGPLEYIGIDHDGCMKPAPVRRYATASGKTVVLVTDSDVGIYFMGATIKECCLGYGGDREKWIRSQLPDNPVRRCSVCRYFGVTHPGRCWLPRCELEKES
jgi:hypothetical protein